MPLCRNMLRNLWTSILANLARGTWSNVSSNLLVQLFRSVSPSNFWIINKTIIQQHIKHCLERTEERISWLFELEDWPFTLNTHYLPDYKNKFLAHYKGTREKYERLDIMSTIQSYNSSVSGNTSVGSASSYRSSSTSQPTGIAKIMAGLAEIGMSGVKPEELSRLFPSDSMEPALVIMAEVRAYFQGNHGFFF